MYTRAERFGTIAEARARFAELSKRLLGPVGRGLDFVVISSYLNNVPHVLIMGLSEPPKDALRGKSGEVVTVDPSVWQSLWLRHESTRPPTNKDSRILRFREPGDGVVLNPDGTTVDPRKN